MRGRVTVDRRDGDAGHRIATGRDAVAAIGDDGRTDERTPPGGTG